MSTTGNFIKCQWNSPEKVYFIDFVEFPMDEPPCLSYNCVISQCDELL